MSANLTPIYREQIVHPSAWTASSIGGKAGVTLTLRASELDALADFLRQTRHIACQDIQTAHIVSPEIRGLAARIREEIFDGSGVVVLAGLTPDRFSVDELSKIFWTLGIQIGTPAVQNSHGGRLTSVRHEANNPKDRGYLSTRELGFHSDAFEILGLLCCQQAYSGGLTQVVSGLSIHNALLKTRPEVLPALYRGYYYATAESRGEANPITAERVPVFSCVDGYVSTMCVGAYMRAAAVRRDEPFPDDLNEALRAFYALCNDERLLLEFMLAPGEILLLNNFTTLHSRTAFEDSATQQRHLLRLWLNVAHGRPVVPALHERGKDYERLHATRAEAPLHRIN